MQAYGAGGAADCDSRCAAPNGEVFSPDVGTGRLTCGGSDRNSLAIAQEPGRLTDSLGTGFRCFCRTPQLP